MNIWTSAQVALAAAGDSAALLTWDIDWIAILNFVVGTVLPLLVAVVTTKVTSSLVKGLLLAGFAFLTTVLTAILDALVSQTPLELGGLLASALTTFAWAVVAYFGIWRAEGKDGVSIADRLNANVGRTVKLSPGGDGVYRRAGE